MRGLSTFLPKQAYSLINHWLVKSNCKVIIKNPRKTKFGDYRFIENRHQISINNDLNKYSFLITLTHEIAHMFIFEKYKNTVLPHGEEWKITFQKLMLNFIPIFPNDIQKAISHHLKNPKASTASDSKLFSILTNYDSKKHLRISEIIDQTKFFTLDGIEFERMHKVRTRIKCKKIINDRIYLFNSNCKIVLNQ